MKPRSRLGRLLFLALPLLTSGELFADDLATCVVDPFDVRPILPVSQPTDLACTQAITASATPGEFEAASFAIKSARELRNVSISASDLASVRARMPAQSVDLKYVKAWYQAKGAQNPVKRDGRHRVLVPELLLNDYDLVQVDNARSRNLLRTVDGKLVDISTEGPAPSDLVVHPPDQLNVRDSASLGETTFVAGEMRQIWITISVPSDALPGEYRGSVKISQRDAGVLAEVPIQLRVLPFRLAPPMLEYSMYYRGQLDPTGRGSVSSELKSEVQLTAELRDMRDHGVTNPTIYQKQLAKFGRVLELRAKEGISNHRIFQLSIDAGQFSSKDTNALNQRRFAELKDITRSFGVSDLFVYGRDEATPEEIIAQRDIWGRVRRAGGRPFAAAYRYGSAEREYRGVLDVLVLGIPFDQQVVSDLRAGGTRVYAYNQPQVGVEAAAAYRYAYGVLAWRAGFDGVMPYAYQHSMGSIWNDFDHPRFKDHVFAYPTVDGIISTLAWEGFREAVDDVRHISTLALLAAHDGTGQAAKLIQAIKRGDVPPQKARKLLEKESTRICEVTTRGPRHELCRP